MKLSHERQAQAAPSPGFYMPAGWIKMFWAL